MSSVLEWLGFSKPKPSAPKRKKKTIAKPPTKPTTPKQRAERSADKPNLAKAHAWQKKQQHLKKQGKPHKRVGRPKGSKHRAPIGRHTCGIAYVDFMSTLNQLGEHLDEVNPDVFRDGESPTDRQTANNLYNELTNTIDRLRAACGCIADSKGNCTFTAEKTYTGFRELLPQLQTALQKKDSVEALRLTQELDTQFDWLMESAKKG